MRKTLMVAMAAAVMACGSAGAQERKAVPAAQPAVHKVVFELNAPAPSGWDQLFNNVINIRKAFEPDAVQVEIVFFGKGLPMLLKSNAAYAARLKEAADKGVTLAACRNSMRALKVTAEDLFPFATTVDSGVAELVRKQEAGWAYVKAGE